MLDLHYFLTEFICEFIVTALPANSGFFSGNAWSTEPFVMRFRIFISFFKESSFQLIFYYCHYFRAPNSKPKKSYLGLFWALNLSGNMDLGFVICASNMEEFFMVTVFEQAKGNHNLQALI